MTAGARSVRSRDSIKFAVTDTNILINFMHIDRLDLFGALPGYGFLVPEHVLDEITRNDQIEQIKEALRANFLLEVSITDFGEMATYADFRRTLGQGEAACLAIAVHRGLLIASDETRAFRREAVKRIGADRLLTTPSLILSVIEAGLASVEEADKWKEKLEESRFSMKFASFKDLLQDG